MIRRTLLVFFFLYSLKPVFSQIVNIENRRIYDDTLGWSGALDGNLSVMQNKEILVNGGFRPRVQYKTRKHYFLLLTDLFYSKAPGKVYANSGMAHLRYTWRFPSKSESRKSPWKWESYTQVQYNQLLDQRLRALLGTGLRCKVADNEKWRVFLGSSAFFEHEELQSSNLIIEGVRWSNYFSFFASLSKELSMTSIIYVQPLVSNFSDYRFMGQFTLRVNVFKRADLRFEFSHFYDAFPPVGVRNFIFNGSMGFRVRLGE
jgi:hypothetical protein